MTALELVGRFSVRLRGPAHDHVFIRTLLSHCQRLVNARLKSVLVSETLTTTPRQQVYPVESSLPQSLRVQYVREGGRDLPMTKWKALLNSGSTWFRKLGARFEVFSLIGRNLLVLHPAKDEGSSVEVVSVKLTTNFDDDLDEVELGDDDLVPVMDLAEAVLLIRERRFDSLPEVMARLTSRLGIERVQSQRAESGK